MHAVGHDPPAAPGESPSLEDRYHPGVLASSPANGETMTLRLDNLTIDEPFSSEQESENHAGFVVARREMGHLRLCRASGSAQP